LSCPRCGYSGPPPTRRGDGLCYECVTGRKTERHHPWNAASFPELKATISIPANVNQVLGHRWSERCDELKNPGDDSLRQLAAAIATIGEGAAYVADYARRNGWPEWIANIAAFFAKAAESGAHWLLQLATALSCHFDGNWVTALDMPSWRPPESER
jgi:hypothetical protein